MPTEEIQTQMCWVEINLYASIILYSKQLLIGINTFESMLDEHCSLQIQNDAERMKNYWRILSDKKNMKSFCSVNGYKNARTKMSMEEVVMRESKRARVRNQTKSY